MDKINDFINEWKTFRDNEEEFNNYINNLDKDTLINLLVHINKGLRRVDNDQEVITEGVIAGELVAVTKEVRNNVVEKLLEYMRQKPNHKDLAALMYYLIINFHMFEDGNGRTARFMYDLISNELDEKEFMYYFHKENDTHYEGKEDFEKVRNIQDLSYANWLSNNLLEHDLKPYLDKYPELKNKSIVSAFGGFYADIQLIIKEFIIKNLYVDLTDQELDDLAQLLSDNGIVDYTPGGIGMLVAAVEKGDIEKWIESNNKKIEECEKSSDLYDYISSRMNFSFKHNLNLLSKWTGDDFRRVIEISNKIKQKQLEYLIDIFKNPNDYFYSEELTIKDFILNEQSVNNNVKKSL